MALLYLEYTITGAMKVTVCQLRNDPAGLEADWEGLAAHCARQGSELVLLPEMPFYPWPFWQRHFGRTQWQAAVAAHDRWLPRLAELAPAAVAGSRPVNRVDLRRNEGFVWTAGDGYRPVHDKYYLPDDPGFWEASWYERGSGTFELFAWEQASAGFLVCTELWFMERARAYGRAGAHLLLTPRATERRTLDKWLAGGRVAAVVAGAFSLSSNPVNDGDPVSLGGQGWIVDPDGEVLALTSAAEPFATRDLDLAQAEAAKQTYPRYVLD
jgi:N-carbamoylputrescine amidase